MSGNGFHFVAIPGSLRRASFARAIAATLDELAPDEVGVEVIDLLATLPLYNQDVEDGGTPSAVAALASAIAAADAVVIVTPEYNHSVPAGLKNGLDWLSRIPSRPLDGKPAAIQSASPGLLGGVRAHQHLRLILTALGTDTLVRPEVIVTSVADKVDAQAGLLRDPGTRGHVALQLRALTELARSHRRGGA